MIPEGLYIRKEIKSLAKELSGSPGGLTLIANQDSRASRLPSSQGNITLLLRDFGNGWCHLKMSGDEEGTSRIMEFVTGSKSIEKVLVWDIDLDENTYSYSLFQKGALEEQFSLGGPALDAVSFTSTIRKVEPRDLINSLDFCLRSIQNLGINIEERPTLHGEEITLDFSLPPPPSFWKRLLGSLSGEE